MVVAALGAQPQPVRHHLGAGQRHPAQLERHQAADGVDVQDVLSKLWGAVGTLAKRPTDSDAVLEAIDAANQIEHIGLPFGFESAIWRDIVGKTLALRAALDSDNEDDQLSDDELQDGCADLHRQLRAYI